jgi:hypothetical protein
MWLAISLPMPGRSVGPLLLDPPPQRYRHRLDRADGVAIGPDAEGVGVLDLEDVGDLLEGTGDFGVVHGAPQGRITNPGAFLRSRSKDRVASQPACRFCQPIK